MQDGTLVVLRLKTGRHIHATIDIKNQLLQLNTMVSVRRTCVLASISAPLSMSIAATAVCPQSTANNRGVTPLCTHMYAQINNVIPENQRYLYPVMITVAFPGYTWLTLSLASISAPLSIRRDTISMCPPHAALCRGVHMP